MTMTSPETKPRFNVEAFHPEALKARQETDAVRSGTSENVKTMRKLARAHGDDITSSVKAKDNQTRQAIQLERDKVAASRKVKMEARAAIRKDAKAKAEARLVDLIAKRKARPIVKPLVNLPGTEGIEEIKK